jgi:hypothetical protein
VKHALAAGAHALAALHKEVGLPILFGEEGKKRKEKSTGHVDQPAIAVPRGQTHFDDLYAELVVKVVNV